MFVKLGIYLQNALLGSHLRWRLHRRFISILICYLLLCTIRNRLFGRLTQSLFCPVHLGLLFVQILFFGLEKCLKIVAIIYLVEEIEFGFRCNAQCPPELACSCICCLLLLFICLRNFNFEVIIEDWPSERLCCRYCIPANC